MQTIGEQMMATWERNKRIEKRFVIIEALGANWRAFRLVELASRATQPILIDEDLAQRCWETLGGITYLLLTLKGLKLVEILQGEDGSLSFQLDRSDEIANALVELLFQ